MRAATASVYALCAMLALAGCISTESEADAFGDPPTDVPESEPEKGAQANDTVDELPDPEPSTNQTEDEQPDDDEEADDPPPAPSDPNAHVPSTRDWGDEDAAAIRPGVDIVGGGQCTSNFLFHLNDQRYFLGVAAHCFESDEGDQFYDACPNDAALQPGVVARLYDRNNVRYDVPLVYNSFWTMNVVGEADGDTCTANDFALVELPSDLWDLIHPSVLSWGGPTAPPPAGQTLSRGDAMYAYGNSDTKATFLVSGEGIPSEASFKEYSDGGWGIQAGPASPPLVPGDSGGPLMGPNGEVLGALSILETTEGDVRWTNIHNALIYMQTHEGWHPSVVTSNDFDP